MSAEQFDTLPPELEVRELRYRIPRKGQRTVCVTIATTLLDGGRYAKGEVAGLWRNVAALRALSEAAQGELAPLATLLADRPLVTVPLLAGDVHDLAGLDDIRRHLFTAP